MTPGFERDGLATCSSAFCWPRRFSLLEVGAACPGSYPAGPEGVHILGEGLGETLLILLPPASCFLVAEVGIQLLLGQRVLIAHLSPPRLLTQTRASGEWPDVVLEDLLLALGQAPCLFFHQLCHLEG